MSDMETPPCTVSPDTWFPRTKDDAWNAARICYTCPFKQACARAALDMNATDGIWAGIDVGRDSNVAEALARTAEGFGPKLRGGPRRIVEGINHGHTGYKHHKCRCDVCRAANAAYRAERKAATA